MTADSVARSLAAAHDWLVARDAPEACIEAHESGGAPDLATAHRWIRRILDEQDAAGSWNGSLLETATALMTLGEIRTAAGIREQDPGIGRGLEWIRERRGVAGAWTDGCSPERHERGTCHHFSGGFFSPAPPEVPLVEGALRSGVSAAGDLEVRFVASATALRCLLRWSTPGPDARLHLEGLRRVVRLWPDSPPPELGTVALLAAVHALLQSSAPEDGAAADHGLRVIAGKQRGDGSWVETDPFQALEVFADAEAAATAPDRSLNALWHGARLLVSTQKPDGSWGGDHAPRRALIACRTFRRLDPLTPRSRP